jgi:hypothetical protein
LGQLPLLQLVLQVLQLEQPQALRVLLEPLEEAPPDHRARVHQAVQALRLALVRLRAPLLAVKAKPIWRK